jgi:DNA adenine methylase
VRIIEAMPFSEVEWEDSWEPGGSEVDVAVRFFVRCRQSRAGQMVDFATLSRNRVRRGMNEQVSAWMTAVDGLPQVAARLKRVVILNEDALNVIQSQDGPNTLFYLDPPYLHETRASTEVYAHEMSDDDHRKLLEMVNEVKGYVMLSGYPSELYETMLLAPRWCRVEFDLPNNAAGGATKRRETECLWTNVAPKEI